MQTSFLDLRNKEIINVNNGKCLGNITDVLFDSHTGEVLGLVVPDCRGFFHIFRGADDIFIPYQSICKIGEDAILVELFDCDASRRNAYTCDAKTANVAQPKHP